MFSSPKDAFKLRNGVEIPCVGFGTYLTPDGDTCVNSVKEALLAGYRHIDTAEFYANEESVGKALAESGISRDEVFVTTKLWNTNQGYDSALRHFEMSVKNSDLTPWTCTSFIGPWQRISSPIIPGLCSTRGGRSNVFTKKAECGQ